MPYAVLHMQQTVLSAQVVEMHSSKIAQIHKLLQKSAVAQALHVFSPKISTVLERKNSTSMLAMIAAFCISVQCH